MTFEFVVKESYTEPKKYRAYAIGVSCVGSGGTAAESVEHLKTDQENKEWTGG